MSLEIFYRMLRILASFRRWNILRFWLPNIISLTEDTAEKLDVDDKVTFDKVRETISNLSGITDKTSISVGKHFELYKTGSRNNAGKKRL